MTRCLARLRPSGVALSKVGGTCRGADDQLEFRDLTAGIERFGAGVTAELDRSGVEALRSYLVACRVALNRIGAR
jgi:hypothetical protein